MHTVADLSCVKCSTSLGWVYLKAVDRDQEYKEGRDQSLVGTRLLKMDAYITSLGAGKYILEAGKVIKENKWSI
jgi:hypothetical protein